MALVRETIRCNGGNYTQGRQGCRIWGIVVHYTASQASARNNCLYFRNNSNCNASAHYFVDGTGIYRSVSDADTAWHCGNWSGNLQTIGIEVVSDGRDFSAKEIANLRKLVRHLMKAYGIPASHVIRHYDAVDYFGGSTLDPHKHCPAPYVNGGKWKKLKKKITGSAPAKWTDSNGNTRYRSPVKYTNPKPCPVYRMRKGKKVKVRTAKAGCTWYVDMIGKKKVWARTKSGNYAHLSDLRKK